MAPDFSRITSSVSTAFGNVKGKLSPSNSKAQQAGIADDDEEAGVRGPAFRNASGGIGNAQTNEADLEVPIRDMILHACILFFTFLGICCFGAVAAFQTKWKIGVSGLTGFALFVSLFTFLISAILLGVAIIYDKWDKLRSFALALKIPRVKFILEGTGVLGMFILAFVTTISAFTQKGCKNAANDPHATSGGDDFTAALPGWCRTKKAGSIFFWLGFVAWAAIVAYTFLAWRKTRKTAPRDAPFAPPTTEDDFDTSYNASKEQSSSVTSHHQPTSGGYAQPQEQQHHQQEESSPFVDPSFPAPYATSRPSTDAYGAFGGSVPEGYGGGHSSEVSAASGMSRTMQMAQANPFNDLRAALTSPPPQLPPLDYQQPPPQQTYYHPQPQAAPYPYQQPTPPPQQPSPYGSYQHPPPQQQVPTPYGHLPTQPGYQQQLPGGYQ